MRMLTSLSVCVAAAVLTTSVAFAEPTPVGAVDKVQAEAKAVQAGASRDLAESGPVYFRDKLHTGPGARLEAKLDDGAVLTLGEKGRMTIDEFVYRPGETTGNALAIDVTKGAFLFVGGKIEGPSGGNVTIKTPVGTLGVRGTTVWGGPIDGGFGVLVLKGEVWVQTAHGTVDLKQGDGTMVFGRRPQKPAPWPTDRAQRAVATVSFAK